MSGTFTIPAPSQTETEIEFCPVLQRAFDLWQAGEHQASFDALETAAPLVGSVSLELAGKYRNQRGLALVGLKQYDQAIAEYQSAIRYFENYGSTSLLAIVKNNLGWVYLQLGQFSQAHESIDDALLLAEREDLKAQLHDTKAQVFFAEGKTDAALVENEQALRLFEGPKRALAECLATREKIKHQKSLQRLPGESNMAASPPQASLGKASSGGTAMHLAAIDCAREILDISHDAAPALFSLIVALTDPDGDPVRYSLAWEVLRLVNSFTPAGEIHLREEIDRADVAVEQSSELPA